jgi:small subunit ribosomal protein S18
MARPTTKRSPKEATRKTSRKVCQFCKEKTEWIDYKDISLLRKFVSDRGKIRARRVTGNCSQHQREVSVAVKTSRELALLPYTQRASSERPGGRGPRSDRRDNDNRDRDNDSSQKEASAEAESAQEESAKTEDES